MPVAELEPAFVLVAEVVDDLVDVEVEEEALVVAVARVVGEFVAKMPPGLSVLLGSPVSTNNLL